jgi:GntR family transcriptional regulator
MQMPAYGNEDMIADAFLQNARRARLPKYLCLHQAITDSVERGDLSPGEQLPPEDKLAQKLGLSIGTVRKAMQTLSDDGLLTRMQGTGTFIADPSVEMNDVWHFCFLNDDGVSFLPLKAHALKVKRTKVDGPWRSFLPKPSSFVMVQRLIDVAGEFSLLSDRFAELEALPQSEFNRIVLRNVLFEHFGIRTQQAPQHLRCDKLNARDAGLINAEPESPGMILETFGKDSHNISIYYQRVVIPSTNRCLAID